MSLEALLARWSWLLVWGTIWVKRAADSVEAMSYGGLGSGVAETACRRWRPRLDGAARRRVGAAAAIGAAEKWRYG